MLSPPASDGTAITEVEIASLRLVGLLPPAWRIRVEHTRNWSPSSSFADAVTEAEQQLWEEGGVIAPAFEDEAIKITEPRAVDVPLIRSLVRNEADAVAIRDRAAEVFGVARRLYEIQARVATTPNLYASASIDYMMVSGDFRVHSVVHSFGGGATTLQLCG